VFDPKHETYEQYLTRWEAALESDDLPAFPFEPAEYQEGKPYPPADDRRVLPHLLLDK
jgi:hypothetical protein